MWLQICILPCLTCLCWNKKYVNRRTSRSTSGQGQEVGRNGSKAIGKKFYKLKKILLRIKKQNESQDLA